jgi:glycine/D-amino acid oxidase-like deaminating enzyme
LEENGGAEVKPQSGGDGTVQVRTVQGQTFRARSVVIAAGAWTRRLVKSSLGLELQLEVTAEEVFYYGTKPGARDHTAAGRLLPVVLYHQSVPERCDFYLLPQMEIPGVKIGWHHSGTQLNVDSLQRLPIHPKVSQAASGSVDMDEVTA